MTTNQIQQSAFKREGEIAKIESLSDIVSKINQRLIIFDSNIYISNKKICGRVLTTIAGKLRKYNITPIIPIIVLNEVKKVTKTEETVVRRKIKDIFKKFLLVTCDKKIESEARRLEIKFYEVHNPDSVILAMAKFSGAILVTLDGKLRRSAKLEGVEAYSLKEFVKGWSVIA